MKSLNTLIKISKNKLEKIRIEKNLFLAQSLIIQRKIEKLNEEIKLEENLVNTVYKNDFNVINNFITFKQHHLKKIAIEGLEKRKLEEKINTLNGLIKNLFIEKKRFEIIKDEKIKQQLAKQKDLEQKNLNEIVLQKFAREKV
jgi:hypothetical protein